MGQDMFNEAYDMGYKHGKTAAYMRCAIALTAAILLSFIIFPLFF